MYKTFVIGYSPSIRKMAILIARSANEISSKGFEAGSFSISNNGKAIILANVADDSNAR